MPASITEYLEATERGEPGARDELFRVVYSSLKLIAANRLGGDKEVLQPTELVHEAWIRLGGDESIGWKNRFHFFAAAAEAMRRTLIDNARKRRAAKRGGPAVKQVGLTDNEPAEHPLATELLDLNDALSAFEEHDSMKAQIVKLKFFAGMTIAEIAGITQLSNATVERYWAYARAWLFDYMNHQS